MREGEGRVCELAAREARKGSWDRSIVAVKRLAMHRLTEGDFREILFVPGGLDLDVATIDREVRRVRALADDRGRPVVSRAAVQATLTYLQQTKRLAAVPALGDLVWPQAPGR